MQLRYNAKHYRRHYVQFNNLVFYNIDMVDEDDYVVNFKTFDEEYTFTDGSYYPLKQEYSIPKMGRVSFTIRLDLQALACEWRPYYIRFATNELQKPGRLWAVKDEELIWAWANITTYREDLDETKGYYSIDVSVDLWEGYWHKADKLKTFIKEFDPCDFMDRYDWKDDDPCDEFAADGDCCDCSGSREPLGACDCCGHDIEKEDALCYFDDYQAFYECEKSYEIFYDCVAFDKFFNDPLSNDWHGRKFCSVCDGHIAGRVYVNTDRPTESYIIRLHGEEMHDPYIEINGNYNIIKGDYSGWLEIHSDGTVYTYKDHDCPGCDPLPISVWHIPAGEEYGWTFYQGYNRFEIDAGTCCQLCVYFQVDGLSI